MLYQFRNFTILEILFSFLFMKFLLMSMVCTGLQPACTWFLKIPFIHDVGMYVYVFICLCMRVCVCMLCMSTPRGLLPNGNIDHV